MTQLQRRSFVQPYSETVLRLVCNHRRTDNGITLNIAGKMHVVVAWHAEHALDFRVKIVDVDTPFDQIARARIFPTQEKPLSPPKLLPLTKTTTPPSRELDSDRAEPSGACRALDGIAPPDPHIKTNEATNVVLPFQVIEQVGEPRAEKPEEMALQAGLFDERERQLKGWTNKLIWGDNNLILSSLKNGPLRDEIEAQGGLKLIYIDPPFDVGADFSMDIGIGDETFTKRSGILEEIA